MYIKLNRVSIVDLSMDMVDDIQRNSIDENNKRFVPDEVFETYEEAEDVVKWLIKSNDSPEGPFIYPIITHDNKNIGYVQACPISNGWEIGYHIAKQYTGNGYATEAVKGFLPIILEKLNITKIYGVVLEDNIASCKVLEKCDFKLEYKGVGVYQGNDRELRIYTYEK